MSATLQDLMDEDGCIRANFHENNGTTGMTDCDPTKQNRQDQVTAHQNSLANQSSVSRQQNDDYLASDGPYESFSSKEAPTLPPQHSSTASRPSSRTSIRPAQKLAPAPLSQSEIEQLMSSIPASDPVLPPSGYIHHANAWSGPMSDMPSVETPSAQPVEERGKGRSGAGARRVRQVQARLEHCIREGQVPPYCHNCGAIETPTWRRAWSKHFEGSEQDANDYLKDPMYLFWTATDRVDGETITKFRLYKKTLVDADKDFDQILLCNRKYIRHKLLGFSLTETSLWSVASEVQMHASGKQMEQTTSKRQTQTVISCTQGSSDRWCNCIYKKSEQIPDEFGSWFVSGSHRHILSSW
jgi:hypothetical protein